MSAQLDHHPDLLYRIALTMIPGIGAITARKIIDRAGSPSAVFKGGEKLLDKVPRTSKILAKGISLADVLKNAEEEMEYIRSEGISAICPEEAHYPARLAHCQDAPLVLYKRGNANFNVEKVIGIVGTRRPTKNGVENCKSLVRDIKQRGHESLIVSGLAFGIDHCAHRSAMANGMQTVAVLGHGLKYLYPAAHRWTANEIVRHGALITDFTSRQKPEPNNFIRRNRIIAGLSDVLIVVESGRKGGALITSDLANSYDREVFAFPGRPGDRMSKGCNQLIKSHQAAMIESCRDLEYIMGWEPSRVAGNVSHQNMSLSHDEEKIIRVMSCGEEVSVDRICIQSGMHVKTVSELLLNLEIRGLVECLPGNRCRLVRSAGQDVLT